MKLYYFPNTCALGIHVLLEEIGKPFTLQTVDFTKQAQYDAAYLALNPKAKVPMLERDDGSVLTEFPAIAWYLARTNPSARLLPEDIESEARALEILDYLIATVHMRGFTRIFRPGAFAPNPEDEAKVKDAGKGVVEQGFKILAPVLGEKDYLLGAFSIVDAALFFLENWAVNRVGMVLPPTFAAHLDRMLARPAVQRALAAEGLA
jgi:glutathione S-transferase